MKRSSGGELVLLCDDDVGTAKQWAADIEKIEELKGQFRCEVLEKREFLEEFPKLESRRQAAATDGESEVRWESTRFDDAAILVLDYDLFGFDPTHYFTGEDVGYLARCFSQCDLVVALNQFKEGFDLTLRGHPDSWADLNILGEQIACRGLWIEPWSDFRPWYWPLLTAGVSKFRRRVDDVYQNFDTPILAFLGLSDFRSGISTKALDFLASGDVPPEAVTFRQFIESSANGLRAKDRAAGPQSAARIAAARIAKWLECWVIPEQDLLIDAPHLISRYPRLLSGDPTLVDSWNVTSTLSGEPLSGMRADLLQKHAFGSNHWASRPLWIGDSIGRDENIDEIEAALDDDVPRYVFCEDISKFTTPEIAREFYCEVSSPFVQRFVVDPEKVESSLRKYVKGVQYRPAFRFAI